MIRDYLFTTISGESIGSLQLSPNIEKISYEEVLKRVGENLNRMENIKQMEPSGLTILHGGLGVRCVRNVSLPAYSASTYGVANLVANILLFCGGRVNISFVEYALAAWVTTSSI